VQEIGIGRVWDPVAHVYNNPPDPTGVALSSAKPEWEKMGDDISQVDTDY